MQTVLLLQFQGLNLNFTAYNLTNFVEAVAMNKTGGIEIIIEAIADARLKLLIFSIGSLQEQLEVQEKFFSIEVASGYR